MSNFKLLSAILRGPWLIDPEYANAHLPLIQSLLSGTFEGFTYKPEKLALPKIVSNQKITLQNSWDSLSDVELDKNSIAVIPVTGPVMKDDFCGSAGSMTMARFIQQADNNPNISAIVLDIDSPGGMVDGTQTFANAIRDSKTPVISIINDGMAASAAYWIASMSDEIYVSQKTDVVGSIGVYLTLVDRQKAYEKLGITIHEIYAPESTDKNKDYKDAVNGDYKKVEAQLSFIAQEFIGAVKSGRDGKLNLSKGDPFTGKTYFTNEAMEIGLIDGMKSMEEVITRAIELSQQNNSNSDKTMSDKKFAGVISALGIEALEISEGGVFLNEEQLAAIDQALTADAETVSAEDHQQVVENLNAAGEAIQANTDNMRAIAALVGVEVPVEGDLDVAAVSASITEKITELQGSAGDNHTTITTTSDTDVTHDEAMQSLDGMAHNQEADNL